MRPIGTVAAMPRLVIYDIIGILAILAIKIGVPINILAIQYALIIGNIYC